MEIKSSQVSYQGLNRRLTKNLFSAETIQTYDKLYPKSNGIVGNIPHQWVDNMPAEERSELIPKLYESLGKFISKKLPLLPGSIIQSRILTNILREHKAIDSSSSVSLKKIGNGLLGKGYRIKNKSDGTFFFLKRFVNSKENKYFREHENHGAKCENNAKTYLNHLLKKKKEKEFFTKFYYGDIKNGYYVEEYLDKKRYSDLSTIPEYERNGYIEPIEALLEKYGLCHTDLHELNIKYSYKKNGDIIIKGFDLGGMELADNLK